MYRVKFKCILINVIVKDLFLARTTIDMHDEGIDCVAVWHMQAQAKYFTEIWAIDIQKMTDIHSVSDVSV